MATYTWTGAVSGDVSLAGNYSPTSGPPGPADTVNETGGETRKPASGSITVGTWNVSGTLSIITGSFSITAAALNFTTTGIIAAGTWNGPATFTRGSIQGGTWNGPVAATDTDGSFNIQYATFNGTVTLDTTSEAGNGIYVASGTFNAPINAKGDYTQIGTTPTNYPTVNSTLTLSILAYVCNVKLGPNGSLVFAAQTLFGPRPFLSRAMTGGYGA